MRSLLALFVFACGIDHLTAQSFQTTTLPNTVRSQRSGGTSGLALDDQYWDDNFYAALNNAVQAIALSGTDLYVGGNFTNTSGDPNGDYIIRWDGSDWNTVGGGLNSNVRAIAG